MAEIATAQLIIDPLLDANKFNKILQHVKKSLGEFAGDVTFIDVDEFADDIREIEGLMDGLAKTTKGALADDAFSGFRKSLGGVKDAFNFNQSIESVRNITSAIEDLSKPYVDLDNVTAQIRTLGPEGKAMADGLREAALQMSKDLPISASEIANTMFDALASGVQGGEEGIKKFADTAGKLAVGGGAEIGQATQLLAGQLNAYGETAEEAGRYADVFFNTVNYGVTSVDELSSTLANVVPTAAGAGIEIENVGGALALMTQKGIPTAGSTTKLNQLLLELQKPAADLAPILEKAGVSLESLRKDDLPTTLGKVSAALKESGKSAVQVFSSSEAGAAFQTLAGDLEGFRKTFEDVRDTAGSTNDAYSEMADSISVQSDGMLAKFEAFVIEGLDIVGPSALAAAQSIGSIAPTVTTIAGLKDVLPIAGFANLAKSAGQFGLSLLQKVVPGLVTTTVAQGAQAAATGAATTATYALNTALLANPLFLVATGAVALAGALFLLLGNSEDVGEALEGVDESINNLNATIDQTASADKQAKSLKELADEYDRLKGKTDPESVKRFAEVGKEIAAVYPDATEKVKQFDAAGKEIGETYKVNTDVVRAFADSTLDANATQREGAIARLAKETQDLGEATADAKEEMNDLKEKKEQIQSQLAGLKGRTDAWAESYRDNLIGQLQDTQIELAEQEKLYNQGNDKLRDTVGILLKQGKSFEEITQETKLSHNQVLLYHAEITTAELKARATADAAEAVKSETEKATDAAADLASQWDASRKQVSSALQTFNAAGAALVKKQQDGQSLNFLERQQLAYIKKETKNQFAEKKAQDAAEKTFLKETGQIVERAATKRSKEQKTAFERAVQALKVENDRIDIAEREGQIARDSERLMARREKTSLDDLANELAKMNALQQQAQALKDALAIPSSQKLDIANVGIALVDKKGEPFEAEKMIADLDAEIGAQANRIAEIRIGAGIEIDEAQIRSLEETQLQAKIELGLADDSNFTEFIVADIERLEAELESTTTKEIERIEKLYENRVLSEEEYNDLKGRLERGQAAQQLELQNAIFARRTTLRDREYELAVKQLERRHEQELAALDEVESETVNIRERIASAIQDIEDRRINRDADDALARLDFKKEQELITEEEYAAKKEQLDRDSAARRAQIAARYRGEQLEAERQAAVAQLELQEGQLREQRANLITHGKFAEAAELTTQIDDVKAQIEEKGGLLTSVMGDLQGEFADAAATLFDFDGERAKEPFRNFFGIMAGALQRMASAKATEVVLGLVSGLGGIPGFIASFAAKPFIDAVLSRFLSPILDSILSFATTGRVDQPTLALIGDASKLGGTNREWIFNDQLLQDVIRMVVSHSNAGMIEEIRLLREDVRALQFKLFVSGQDLTTAVGRTRAAQNRRIVNSYALAA